MITRLASAALPAATTLLVAACAHSGAGAAAASPGRAACERAMVEAFRAGAAAKASGQTGLPTGLRTACAGLDKATTDTLAQQAFATFMRQATASPRPVPSFTGFPPDSGFTQGGTVLTSPSPSGS